MPSVSESIDIQAAADAAFAFVADAPGRATMFIPGLNRAIDHRITIHTYFRRNIFNGIPVFHDNSGFNTEQIHQHLFASEDIN